MNCLIASRQPGLLRRLPLRLIALAAIVCLIPSARAQAGNTAVIRGQVTNGGTNSTLEGVQIVVTETGKNVSTDRDGTYEIAGLATGTYTLNFTYPGLDKKAVKVVLDGPGAVRQDVALTSNLYVLEEFHVAAEREGNAAAIVQQKEAINVKNVVTSDAFGNIAKGNIGNFLKRLPGVATVFDEADSEQLILRGMPASFSTVEINGTRAASGEPGSRTQFLGEIPTDSIEKAEVIKATTPDVDADSMAGRINLVTKSSLDYKGQRITARISDSYSPTYGKEVAAKGARGGSWLQPSIGASYSNVFGKEQNLGIVFNTYLDQTKELRGTTQWNYVSASGGTPAAGAKDYIDFNNASIAHHFLLRAGASTQVDYRVSPSLKLVTSLGYNSFKNDMDRAREQLTAGTIDTFHSDPNPYYSVVDNVSVAPPHETRDQMNRTYNTRFAGEYKGLGNGTKVDFDLTYAVAKRREHRTTTTFTSKNKFDYALDRYPGDGSDQRWPAVRVISATGVTGASTPIVYTGANPFFDTFTNATASLEWQDVLTQQFVKGTHLNLSKDMNWNVPVEFKTGVRWRETNIDTHRNDFSGGINPAITDLSPYLQTDFSEGGALNRYPIGTEPNVNRVGQVGQIWYTGGGDPTKAWHYDPSFVSYNASTSISNSLGNDKKLSEDVDSAYVMATVTTLERRLQILGGLRMEHTQENENVPLRNRAITDPVAQWGGRQEKDSKYTNYFPSLNIRYTFTPNLVLHASVTKTIGRPDYGDILATQDIDTTASPKNITVGNLDLKPRHSTNYDASLEYYFEPAGVVSVGVFQDHITDFSFSQVSTLTTAQAADLGAPVASPTEAWTLTEKVNGGWALNTGIELNYSQQFTFLPGALRGFGLNANFTYLHIRGTYDRAGLTTPSSQLQGFIPRTANAGIFYNYGKVDVKLMYNFSDTWLESYNSSNPASQNQWRGSRYFLDLQAKYRLSRHFRLFADFMNFTHQDGKKYEGWINQARRWQTNGLGATISAGANMEY